VKERTEKSFVFGDVNERPIFLTYINETTSMKSHLRDIIYTYEYRKIIISIRIVILDGET
jgi:hypothetical protein